MAMEGPMELWGQGIFASRRGPRRKAPFEGKMTWELSRRTGEWCEIWRFVDRESDRYLEVVRNQNGDVIHAVDEPLSQHQRRGAARYASVPR
jgi:hypothetical protein